MVSRLFLVNGVLLVGILASASCGGINGMQPVEKGALTGLIILVGSACAAMIWGRALWAGSAPAISVSARKEEGIQQAMDACFSGLWFVPCRCLTRVCILRWSRNVLRHGATVQTALISSFSARHLVVGCVTLLLACVAAATDLQAPPQGTEVQGWSMVALTTLICWISHLFFFHWFLRSLLIDKPLRSTRPTFSECNAAFANQVSARHIRR